MKKIFFVLVCLSMLAAVSFADPGDNLNWPDAPVTQELYSYGYIDGTPIRPMTGQFEVRLIPIPAENRVDQGEIPNIWYISDPNISEYTVELTYNPDHYESWESLMSADWEGFWAVNPHPVQYLKSWFRGKLTQPTIAPHAWRCDD